MNTAALFYRQPNNKIKRQDRCSTFLKIFAFCKLNTFTALNCGKLKMIFKKQKFANYCFIAPEGKKQYD